MTRWIDKAEYDFLVQKYDNKIYRLFGNLKYIYYICKDIECA